MNKLFSELKNKCVTKAQRSAFNELISTFQMQEMAEVTFKTTNPEQLTKIVNAIGKHGNGGHSFDIVIDADDENKESFFWDGDGSDRVEINESVNTFAEREKVSPEMLEKAKTEGVIQKKPNGKWGIISIKAKEWWIPNYDSRENAEDALKAYHANKGFSNEEIRNTFAKNKTVEYFIDQAKDNFKNILNEPCQGLNMTIRYKGKDYEFSIN